MCTNIYSPPYTYTQLSDFIIFLKTVNFIDCEYHLIVLMSMFLISNKAQNNTS